MYGSVNVPGAAATVEHGGAMSAADKLSLETLKNLTLQTEMVRTRSGNPVIFPDGADAPVKELVVTLAPTQAGSGDPSPDNIRPISGVSSVSVTRTGKNLFDGVFVAGTINSEGILTPSTNRWSNANFILVNPDTAYALSRSPAFWGAVWHWYDAQKNYINGASGSTATHISPTDARFLRFTTDSDPDGKTFQLEYGTVPTAYEPYQGQSVTVQLTDGANPLTVYGGTLEVTTGTLSITWANIASYSGEPLPGRWISDRDVYASGATPTTGAQVAYERATPVTYQLTPQQLAALSGYNAVSADAGTLSVTYRADPALAYAELESSLTNAILSLGAGI